MKYIRLSSKCGVLFTCAPGFRKFFYFAPEYGQLAFRVWRWWWITLMWEWRR